MMKGINRKNDATGSFSNEPVFWKTEEIILCALE